MVFKISSAVFLLIFIAIGCNESVVSPDENLTIDPKTNEIQKEIINANVSSVNAVAINSSGSKVAWGGNKNEITIMGKHSLKGHIGSILSLSFNKSGNLLASGSRDHNIKIWDSNTGSLLKTFSQHLTETKDIKFSPDGKSIISAEGNHIVYWRNVIEGSTGKGLFWGHTGIINAIDIDRNGELLISGSSDFLIKLWNAETGSIIQTLNEHRGSVLNVRFNPAKSEFASSGRDSSIIIWNLLKMDVENKLHGHIGIPMSIDYHPSGKYLACGSSNSIIYIWDLETGKLINQLLGHQSFIKKIKFSGDGTKIVSGGSDDKVIIWSNFLPGL